MRKKFFLLVLYLFYPLEFLVADLYSINNREEGCSSKKHSAVGGFMRNTIYSLGYFNYYLFSSPDTYKILLSTAPFYGIGRVLDGSLHDYFYNAKKHRNIHELAPVFDKMVDPLMGTSLTILLLLQFIAHDEHTRSVSRAFLAGLPFLWVYKDIIKALPFDGNIRPKNEHFCCNKKYYGGFPSGHMFEATFMAYLFGSELGASYAIPLTAFATLVAVQSVASNRHTVSQVIAGTACGCMFAVAARKLVRRDLHDRQSCGILINGSGQLALSFEKKF